MSQNELVPSGASKRYADYDAFARAYNLHWGPKYEEAALPLLKKLLLDRLPAPNAILDLCCGTGHVTRVLEKAGYLLTGIDGSKAMLEFARRNAPKSSFLLFDARAFSVEREVGAVISMNDSLNHIMELKELCLVFQHVKRALRPGGWFLFDLNLPHKYENNWDATFSIVEDDLVIAVRAGSDLKKRRGDFKACIFEKQEGWIRSDVTLYQTWYPVPNVLSALERTGFEEVAVLNKEGLEISDYRIEKAYFRCRKAR